MTKVKLRQKQISGGRQSLYLDFYPPIPHPETGKPTRREFLSLFLFEKPKTTFDKEHNKDTFALAENIRAKRQISIQNEQYGFLSTQKNAINFITYFKEQAAKRSLSNQKSWQSAAYHLDNFFKGHIKVADLNEKVCIEYREYLLKAPNSRSTEQTISRNSALTYFTKFKSVLLRAYKDGLLQVDLSSRVDSVKRAETHREYLTLEELQTLAKTECALPILKQAALFSALTGLRFSDIQKLTWGEVQYSNSQGYYLQFRQKKTAGVETLPISNQAVQILGKRGETLEVVFKGLIYSNQWNLKLKHWVLKAGITKDITFHCFRHTYATLQLTLGTDIYTVSKMLGHRDLRTTQVYAKVVDKAKREAADKIKLEL